MLITNKHIEVSLAKSLQSSYDRQTLCEVTIMCEGKKIRCHRHVLCLHSNHFNDLFMDPVNYPTTIAVVNMKYEHLKAMMDYMYHGKIKLSDNSEETAQIIKCADDLGLTALKKFIEDYMKTHIKRQQNSLNGDHKLSTSDMNGDADAASKRKRASDATARVNLDGAKKPKINDSFTGPLNQSTPLRDGARSLIKPSSTETKPNSEHLSNDKKRKPDTSDEDDDESSIKRAKEKEAEEERNRKEAEKKKRQEEEDRKRKEEEEKQRLEAERRKLAEEEKRKAAEEAKRKAEEEERIRIEEERKRKEEEKKKREAEEAKKIEEEKARKENNLEDTKLCDVCNKEYKYNVDHKKILDGVQFDKKCIIGNCSKPLKFRRSLIDHLLKEHKIDVCDG